MHLGYLLYHVCLVSDGIDLVDVWFQGSSTLGVELQGVESHLVEVDDLLVIGTLGGRHRCH